MMNTNNSKCRFIIDNKTETQSHTKKPSKQLFQRLFLLTIIN